MDAARPIIPSGFESGPSAEGAARATPVMEQYIEIKAANPDCLLFYRMGDFYELFFEDAEIAARALGIVLTKRGKHLGRDIPMCGVPVHRADEYLHRLIALGHRVAVCEQLEDPAEAKKRGGKSVVRRDVIRVVTPGTLTEETLLEARRNNYLLAIARARGSAGEESRFALAWIDISTGEFRIAECDRAGLAADIARLEPGEIIVSDALYGDAALAPYLRSLPAGAPPPDPAAIERRHDAVEFFVTDAAARADMRERLAAAPDLARALARLVLERGGPRDLAAIRDGIIAAGGLASELEKSANVAAELAQAARALRGLDPALATELNAALAEELPHLKRDGGFVRAGYVAALDEARALRDESRRVIAALQARYAETTSVRVLKIRHNNVLGYFVEVTAQHGERLMAPPLNATFIHRQTLAGQVRFTTTELGELEAKIASAAERALAIELETFERLAAAVTAAASAPNRTPREP